MHCSFNFGLLLCVFVGVAGCAEFRVAAPDSARLDSLSIAGTYALRVCRGRCADSSNVLRRGYLVLNPGPLQWTPTADGAPPPGLRTRYRMRGNLCYAIDSESIRGDTYAGLDRVASTEWTFDSTHRQLELYLYRSPDASYRGVLVGRENSDTLRGHGKSYGFGTFFMRRSEELIAIRTGPPDPSKCEEAARREWINLK